MDSQLPFSKNVAFAGGSERIKTIGKMIDGEHLCERTYKVYPTHSCYKGQFLGKLWC